MQVLTTARCPSDRQDDAAAPILVRGRLLASACVWARRAHRDHSTETRRRGVHGSTRRVRARRAPRARGRLPGALMATEDRPCMQVLTTARGLLADGH